MSILIALVIYTALVITMGIVIFAIFYRPVENKEVNTKTEKIDPFDEIEPLKHWKPSQDMDYIRRGKLTDPFD